MKKVLINFAHPAKRKSKINKALIKGIESLENVTINDLYAKYPDFLIDVKEEQKLCEEHDIIIFQHPFYWYQAPSIVKEWFDLVLEHGWAYGSTGNALKGKIFIQAITAGNPKEAYTHNGFNKFTVEEFMAPFMATANLCKMVWKKPFKVLGVHRGLPKDEIIEHTNRYIKFIKGLQKEEL